MKIALYAPSWPPGSTPNGIVTYSSYLVSALRRLGHEVYVISADVKGTPDSYTIDLRNAFSERRLWDRAISKLLPEAALFNRVSQAIVRAISNLVAEKKIDVFEIEDSFGWSYALSRLKIVPVIVRLHGPWFLMGKYDQRGQSRAANRYRQNCEGRAIGCANYVTANCFDTVEAVRIRYNLPLLESRVIPNPMDPVREEDTWRLEECDPNRILFVGRFDKVKGGDLALRAFGRLAALFPDLKLTFVGPDRGIQTSGGENVSFHQFVIDNFDDATRSRIDFLGQVKHAEVMAMRTKHFMTLIAAQYDTMGYMMMEAMSLGCPIITTAVGGIPEYIKDKRNGLLIPSQDTEAMVAACKLLLENKNLARAIGRQAWLDCCDICNPDRVGEETTAVYRDAIAKTQTRH